MLTTTTILAILAIVFLSTTLIFMRLAIIIATRKLNEAKQAFLKLAKAHRKLQNKHLHD